ncbi:MAG: haloacid dehalogenase-like hydrolase [Clostridia bacterium]|nr:haloacid dehalogenase-like hydrolase [Clostridia bacterium]
MNVYDFDGTIYGGESSCDFFFYCLKRYPKKMWKYLFKAGFYGLGYVLRLVKKIEFKQKFLSFVREFSNIESLCEDFWQVNQAKIHKWYLEQKQPTDIIISASPEFLLKPIAKMLGVGGLIASRVERRFGVFYGPNCHGKEKVRRFKEIYPDAHIDEFYSDMNSDRFMGALADKAYKVKGEKVTEWVIKK